MRVEACRDRMPFGGAVSSIIGERISILICPWNLQTLAGSKAWRTEGGTG